MHGLADFPYPIHFHSIFGKMSLLCSFPRPFPSHQNPERLNYLVLWPLSLGFLFNDNHYLDWVTFAKFLIG